MSVPASAAAAREEPRPGAAPSPRLASLDVFRGATIAGMLVVNTPGTWQHVYPPLLHAEWNGWTYTDTIFPFFLFVVGVSMALSFSGRTAKGEGRMPLLVHTLRRAAIIFGIGLALNVLSFFIFHREHVRIMGVLQRIGICYFFAAMLYLGIGSRGLLPSAVLLLLGYWALMTLVPVPGYGPGRLDLEGNLARYVDAAVLGEHTWKHKPNWDPEGLLSTIPAVATVLLGIAAGELLRVRSSRPRRLWLLALAGGAAFGIGLLWGRSFPINKNLWTSSYALAMSGLAALCLSAAVVVVDVRGWRAWAAPLRWLGMNALAIFSLSILATLLLLWVKLRAASGKNRSLYSAIYQSLFDRFADPRLGSLLFALAFLSVFVALALLLYRRRIFIKV